MTANEFRADSPRPLLVRLAAHAGETTALRQGDDWVPYGDLTARVGRIAGALARDGRGIGGAPVAFLAEPGPTPTLDELQAFARARLAPYEVPRALRLLPALSRNAMGKVQKKQRLEPRA
ncbi:MAG TPA: hypothetical protein VH560_04870 [Polyangia bacterium]|nr:hypothetical protein [Polyangia bacterium]